jgi:2-methylisocitrate lyase-like PEP mutase family enzyme
MNLAQMAERLRALHAGPEPLVLPNAWDAATARAVVEAGFAAVATSSVAVAHALGYEDGEQTPAAEMFAAIARISRAVDVPVTADIEAGYGLAPDEVAKRLLDAGAVGCNLEDTNHATKSLSDPNAQLERLQAFKQAAHAQGVDVVLNARTDVFLREGVELPLDEAIRRGRLYLEAKADCIYPIGAPDEPTIVTLVDGIPAPINVIAGFRSAPGWQRLHALGVRRISYAGRLFRTAMVEHQKRLNDLRAGQEF